MKTNEQAANNYVKEHYYELMLEGDLAEAFKAGAEWQKKQDELTWQDIAEIWHIVEDLYDSGDYTGDAPHLFYNEALEKYKKYKEEKK